MVDTQIDEVAAARHKSILAMLRDRYDRPIMNNVDRGDYVECMIVTALGADWRLTWADGWDWAAWDCEHTRSGIRLEVKQAAARQSWDGQSLPSRRNTSYDIKPRKGYWTRHNKWVTSPGRLAHIYVFAWHGRRDERTDQRDPEQWRFFVVPELDLPRSQKSIGLARLKQLAAPCGLPDLRVAIEAASPIERAIKNARE